MAHELITDGAAFDLDAYFARIGYTGRREGTLDALRELHLKHVESIAFENLNPLLRWPVRLDTASLVQKLVSQGRGGYCFEQNLLFAHVLHALGFNVRGLSARVAYNQPPGTVMPRSHMLLAIEIDGRTWIADVGFGGLTLTAPLMLAVDVEQVTPHEPFRLTSGAEWYQLEARLRDTWTPLYRFTMDKAYLPDYEVASWYLCHYPGSHFLSGLIAARAFETGRHAVRGNVLTTHHRSGATERRVLVTGAEVRSVLEHELALTLPASSDLDAALEQVAASSVAL